MNFNIGSVLSLMNGAKGQNAGINMALNFVAKKNPGLANTLRGIINSGKSPQQAISEAAKEGKINMNQLNQIHGFYNILHKMGLKQNVPDSTWKEAENCINSANSVPTPTNNDKFVGF